MKIQLITAIAALLSCREKSPDPFDLSEDIDLAVSPEFLGLPEAGTSRNQANKWMASAEAVCGNAVREQIEPVLEATVEAVSFW
jgi:hypothetical protein